MDIISKVLRVIEKNKKSVFNVAIIGAKNPAEIIEAIKNAGHVKTPIGIELVTGKEINLFSGYYTISSENKDIITTLVIPPIEECFRTGGTIVVSGNMFLRRTAQYDKDSIEYIINQMICMNYLELRNGTLVKRHRECIVILLLDKENYAPESILNRMDLILTEA